MGTYTVDSFAAICNHVTETSIVIVRAGDDRFTDLQSLVDYAKEEDFRVKASTNGPQASNHIGAQAFASNTDPSSSSFQNHLIIEQHIPIRRQIICRIIGICL